MANENILIKSYDNISLIDPNKVINANGFPEDRNVKQEDLVFYANLECNLKPRSRLIVGEDSTTLEKVSIAKVNFLKPNDSDYLTTSWTDFFTGRDGSNTLNNELLGITNITYRCNPSFMPTVDIILEDVRGRALFESGNDSVYSVFFNLPYPTFYLTLKGYYGKAVRYQLILQKFQASFEQSSGNFVINLNFLGYKYNVLTDIQQGYILALPSMYIKEVSNNISTNSISASQLSVDGINGNNLNTNTRTVFGGYEKLKDVYKIYKTKKLISENFPELTIQELIYKIENFEKKIISNFNPTSVDELTNAQNFKKIINNYKKDVMTAKPDSPKVKNLDDKFIFYMTGTDSKIYEVFTYKKDKIEYKSVVTEFEKLIEKYNSELESAPTFGSKGGKKEDYKIQSTISLKNIVGDVSIDVFDINVLETAKKRNNTQTPTATQIRVIEEELALIKQKQEKDSESGVTNGEILTPFFFRFEGPGFFLSEIDKLNKSLDQKSQIIEDKITNEINSKLESSQEGIGFKPTIRNIIAIIMASTDGFLRKLDDVHVQAFENRNNTIKKKSCSDDVKSDNESPVYPWPQYVKQLPADDKGVPQYDLKYPGDPDYINDTGAYDYNVWPEVEFVEEFVKGLTNRQQPPLEIPPQSNVTETIKRISISSFDTPSNISYSNTQSQNFFYEIWERIQSISHYQGFVRGEKYSNLLNFLQASESTNIQVGLGNGSIDINNPLKNNAFTPVNYLNFLKEISNNGISNFYQNLIRGNLSTEYLRNEILNSSKILKKELPEVIQEFINEVEPTKVEESVNKYLQDTDKNSLEFTDTYPFVLPDWNKLNLNNGQANFSLDKVLDVSKSLFYSPKIKKITNFIGGQALDNLGDTSVNRPFTYVPTVNSKINYGTIKENLSLFYANRIELKNLDYAEGTITKTGTTPNFKTTSSILNTPFFIKAIQEGVDNQKNNSPTPYISASYLFLISLTLSDVNYQYLNTSTQSENNYIATTLRKYGSIHALPKLWIARIGAIYYRYKNYINNNTDILTNVFIPMNFNSSYDPVTASQSKEYSISTNGETYKIKFYSNETTVVNNETKTIEKYNLGFYPKILNDFYYFLNGENLYESNATLEQDIQSKIDSEDILLKTNSNSSVNKGAGYNLSLPNNHLSINNFSVLIKNNNTKKGEGVSYYSAPSFGSCVNQVNTECFSNGQLIRPIDNSVYNGSVRFYWGGTHFGYLPSITSICNFNEIPKTNKDKQWTINLNGTQNTNVSFIDFILATFTKQELDLFETEFLNFAKSKDDSEDDFNLQSILQKMLSVSKQDFYDAEPNNLIEKFQTTQQTNFTGQMKSFINLNFLFQKGNPTNLDYKVWVEQSKTPNRFLENNAIPNSYIPNSLPVSGNSTTLVNSESNYPDAWKALKLNVGFFEWERFKYSDNGSYITDFFVEMNIEFTKENIEKYASLIKIFATQKYLNSPNSNFSNDFRIKLTEYLTSLEKLRNEFFAGAILKVQKNISELKPVTPEGQENSKTTGQLTKLEYYELFKSINDKWVSGNNYNSETLFEDFLFFDRANRDIGDEVIVDIFGIVKYLKSTTDANVLMIATSIIQSNNFVIYSMPAYVNFYNVQSAEEKPSDEGGEYSFAEKFFGLYTEVDYQSSKQKIICQYTEKPSEQTKNPSQYNGYKNDSWNFGDPTNDPLRDKNLSENTNFALRNKVVGMNVDFGLQNQGVFKTIQVSQDIGKATSESLQMEYELANIAKGTQAYTQNVSLYNIYKSRSYSSTVTCFGNAMIQPTMYFNLQNIPLFSGPYLITDVEHVITPSDFSTKFTGTRQKLFTPPIVNPLLSIIKNNFLNKLIEDLKTKKEKNKETDSNTISQKDSIAESISDSNTEPSQNPQCKPISEYDNYSLKSNPSKTTKSVKEIQKTIYGEISRLSGSTNMQYVIYTLFYLNSFKKDKFEFYENNVSKVPLGGSITQKWGGDLSTLFKNEYMCLKDKESSSYATFDSVEKCVEFNYKKYYDKFKNLLNNSATKDVFVSGFTKTWIEQVPVDKTVNTNNLYNDFVVSNNTEFEQLKEKVEKAWSSVTTYISQI